MSDDTDITISTGEFNIFLKQENEVRRVFDILKEGGTVEQEPTPEFWTSMFCIVTDRFGVKWHIVAE